MVDVVQEQVKREQPLRKSGFDLAPFGGGNDPRDQVERENALGALGVIVHGERNPAPQEGQIDRGAALVELCGWETLEPFGQPFIVRPHRSAAIFSGKHLVEEVT